MHRHADARWRQTPKSVQELSLLQAELLSQTSTYVKLGGILVYATCTLHPLENEGVIQPFLAQHPNWQVDLPLPDSTRRCFCDPRRLCQGIASSTLNGWFFYGAFKKKIIKLILL